MGYLFLLFIMFLTLELYVLIKVGAALGPLNTIALLILSGITGTALAKSQGLKVLFKIQEQLDNGVVPNEELLEGLIIVIGAGLLVMPGFISDCLGLFFLVPWTRRLLKAFIKGKIQKGIKKGSVTAYRGGSFRKYDDIDIN